MVHDMSIKLRRIGKAKAKPLVLHESSVSAKVAFQPRSAATIFRELEDLSNLNPGGPAGPGMNSVLSIVATNMAALEQRLKETLDSLCVFTARTPVSQQAARHEYATQLEALVAKSVITPLEAAKLLREREMCRKCCHPRSNHGAFCNVPIAFDHKCGCLEFTP